MVSCTDELRFIERKHHVHIEMTFNNRHTAEPPLKAREKIADCIAATVGHDAEWFEQLQVDDLVRSHSGSFIVCDANSMMQNLTICGWAMVLTD